MNKKHGLSFIEILMFIVVLGVLATSILVSFNIVSKKIGWAKDQTSATAYAVQCLEWFLGQRNFNGFTSVNCDTTVPTFCSSNLPSGYTISTNVTCTTYYGDSNNYKTITTVVNSSVSNANLSIIIANY